jgi:hypothetical protein
MNGLYVAMVVGLVAIGCEPPSSVRIAIVGPTDTAWRGQPIWRFAVTNEAHAQVWWAAGVKVKGNSDREFNIASGSFHWPEGRLAPGQRLETDMIVPGNTDSLWRGCVWYGIDPHRKDRKVPTQYTGDWLRAPNPTVQRTEASRSTTRTNRIMEPAGSPR